MKINFKNFTLQELKNVLPSEVSAYIGPGYSQVKPNQKLTICDNGDFNVSRGSENIYLSLTVYDSDINSTLETEITIYSKDDHQGVKDAIKELIKQF